MNSRSWFGWALSVWVVLCMAGCAPSQPSKSAATQPSEAAASQPSDSAPAAPPTNAAGAPQPQTQPGLPLTAAQPQTQANVSAGAVPAPASESKARAKADSKEGTALAEAEAKPERPGLATQFGEDLSRTTRTAPFHRESPSTPFAATTIWYNDAAGSEVVSRSARQRSGDQAKVALFNGGLLVSLVDEHARILPGFSADAKLHAIGEANARYSIHVENLSDYKFEVVASVDGLSVIDGRPASFERRGYILGAHDDMLIEGFRTSADTVAAFRFGKVNQSYSVEMGYGARNVGVIGVAFFEEQGEKPLYSPQDTRLRDTADPFPGNYAPRPKAH